MTLFNERFKAVRKESGLTQVEFGRLIGVTGATISYIESGSSKPSAAALKIICSTYRVRYDWLMYGEGEMYEESAEESLVDRYAPNLDESFKAVLRQMDAMPDAAWEALRDYVLAQLDAVQRMRNDRRQSLIEEKVSAYRAELIAQMDAETSSPSQTTGAPAADESSAS